MADLEALGEAQLLELAHVALDGQRLLPSRAAGSGARTAGFSAMRFSTVFVHGPRRDARPEPVEPRGDLGQLLVGEVGAHP